MCADPADDSCFTPKARVRAAFDGLGRVCASSSLSASDGACARVGLGGSVWSAPDNTIACVGVGRAGDGGLRGGNVGDSSPSMSISNTTALRVFQAWGKCARFLVYNPLRFDGGFISSCHLEYESPAAK